jgi:hypothetical protein
VSSHDMMELLNGVVRLGKDRRTEPAVVHLRPGGWPETDAIRLGRAASHDDRYPGTWGGAYGVTASPLNFISHAPPREILIETVNDETKLVEVTQFEPRPGCAAPRWRQDPAVPESEPCPAPNAPD